MAYEEKTKAPAMPHSLTLDERQRLSVTGVEEVMAFDENEISVRTVKGILSVRGRDLKVDKLEKHSGELTVSGLVTDMGYEETGSGQGFWSRLLHG